MRVNARDEARRAKGSRQATDALSRRCLQHVCPARLRQRSSVTKVMECDQQPLKLSGRDLPPTGTSRQPFLILARRDPIRAVEASLDAAVHSIEPP